MTICYAVLLDGGFLRYKLGKPNAPVDAAGIRGFIEHVRALPCLQGMRLHRVYFYDSKPLEIAESRPLSGGKIEFGATAAAARNKSLVRTISSRTFVKKASTCESGSTSPVSL